MRYDLRALARRAGKRRSFALPTIAPSPGHRADLAAIYLRVVRAWSEAATGPLLAAYTRALGQMGDGATFRDDAGQARAAIDAAAAELNRLILTLTPSLREWAVRVEKWHRGRFVGSALSAAGVNLDTVIGPQDAQETVETVIARNAELVRNVSDQTRGRIADIVFRGLNKRTPARQVAKEMNEAVGLGRDRSLRIASDQQVKITAALDKERQRAAGLDEWVWRWSHKANGRPEHAKRDGKRYTDDTAPEDEPGELPYCGCKRQAWIDLG